MPNFESCVFLPSYVLQFIDEKYPKFNPDAFLSSATPERLLEIILAFYPHFTFTQKAKDDRELLRKMFIEMVAPRFSNIVIPAQSDTRLYFQAPLLRFPSCLAQEPPKTIDSSSDVDPERTTMFNIYGLSNLNAGLYRHASQSLSTFIERYKFLNEDEVSAIGRAQDLSEDNLNDSVSNLKEGYQSIERLQLHLAQSNISSDKRSELENQLKSAIAVLRCRQKLFDETVQNVAFLSALYDYHEEIWTQNTPNHPEPSTQDMQATPPASPKLN